MDIVITFFILIILAMLIFSKVAGVLVAILWILEIFMAGCALLFLSAIAFFIGTKKRQVELKGFGEFGDVPFAIYVYEGEEYKNIFPTDSIFKNILYRNKTPKVFLGKRFGLNYAFDKLTIIICAIGLPFFSLMTAMFGGYLALLW